ncbi:hypothetical protein BJ166DRAFT_322389 [Pestalotiopsis sp. NC0098]|nr:hypothetical protein BJ166DRAFT_322389 [Pestalotiopsis sp. NC0098]
MNATLNSERVRLKRNWASELRLPRERDGHWARPSQRKTIYTMPCLGLDRDDPVHMEFKVFPPSITAKLEEGGCESHTCSSILPCVRIWTNRDLTSGATRFGLVSDTHRRAWVVSGALDGDCLRSGGSRVHSLVLVVLISSSASLPINRCAWTGGIVENEGKKRYDIIITFSLGAMAWNAIVLDVGCFLILSYLQH